jgi:hypothetical protein
MSLVALNSPKYRLNMELESAAMKAHLQWHMIDHGEGYECDDDAPTGRALVAWYKRTHPRNAVRIERAITKELWAE